MLNKKLEDRLKKKGYDELIKFIETCETDKSIKEISIDKIKSFTDNKIINRMIDVYLKELNIKINYCDMKVLFNEIFKSEEEKKEIKINMCENEIHLSLKNKLNAEKKKEILKKYNSFKIDDKTYANCPDCFIFEEVN